MFEGTGLSASNDSIYCRFRSIFHNPGKNQPKCRIGLLDAGEVDRHDHATKQAWNPEERKGRDTDHREYGRQDVRAIRGICNVIDIAQKRFTLALFRKTGELQFRIPLWNQFIMCHLWDIRGSICIPVNLAFFCFICSAKLLYWLEWMISLIACSISRKETDSSISKEMVTGYILALQRLKSLKVSWGVLKHVSMEESL